VDQQTQELLPLNDSNVMGLMQQFNTIIPVTDVITNGTHQFEEIKYGRME
jgi:hypothetical protein